MSLEEIDRINQWKITVCNKHFKCK
jgi:hypothetical protein